MKKIVDKKYASVWDDIFDSAMEKKARIELGETPQVREHALMELKQYIAKEENLNCLMEESFLLRFLRYAKYDTKKAFKALCNYYKYKHRYRELFFSYKPTELQKALYLNFVNIFPYKTEAGESIAYLNTGNVDLDKIKIEEAIALVFMAFENLANFQSIQICGLYYIVDMKHHSYRFLWKALPYVYSFVKGLEGCFPIRIKGIHIINAPIYYRPLVNAAISIISEKLKKRFYVHGSNMRNVHHHLPREILTSDVDGCLGPSDNTQGGTQYFWEHQDLVAKINSYGYKYK